MILYGNSYQEKEPKPTEPIEIKNNIIIKAEPYIKDGDIIYKKDGKWYLRKGKTNEL